MTPRPSAWIWIALAASQLLGAARAPVYLGVLEAPIGQSREFHLRVAFRFADGCWQAMPTDEVIEQLAEKYPAQASWTIALHGKRLGQVSSARPAAYSRLMDVGLENLSADSKPPAIPDEAAAFAGWMGAPHFRPLPAVSEPNYGDPDDWKSFAVPGALRKRAVAAFRREIALDMNCDGKSPRSYPDSAIQIYGNVYRSRRGDVLMAMRPDAHLNRCDGPAGDEWQSIWFVVKGDDFRRIGNSLTLVDIGDYGGDGVSQVLFQYDGYDRDGYVLFDPRADSKVEFSWEYH